MTVFGDVPGMKDIFGDAQRYLTYIKKIARHEFRKNGFTRISTPIFESREILERVYEGDILSNIALFPSFRSNEQEYILRPESFVSVMRAYIAHCLDHPQPSYFYSIERCFHHDNVLGTLIQDYHLGADIIGESDPILDAKMIHIGYTLLTMMGLASSTHVKVNFLGNPKEKEKYTIEIQNFFQNAAHSLSEADRILLTKNPLAILGSTHPDTQELIRVCPRPIECMRADSKKYITQVQEYLTILGVPYTEDITVVPAHRYACQTVWAFDRDNAEGVRVRLGTGNYYEWLSRLLGAKADIPWVGCIFLVDDLIAALRETDIRLRNKDTIHLYFVQLGDEAKKLVLPLHADARERGLHTLLSLGAPSIKTQLKKAGEYRSRFVAVIGMMEAKNGVCQLKDMELGTQEEIRMEHLVDTVIERIGTDQLDFYYPNRDYLA